jgi:hypothetical protein
MRTFFPKNLGLGVGESKLCGGINDLRKHDISFFTVSAFAVLGFYTSM